MKKLVSLIQTLMQLYKPATLNADYLKVSFQQYNELAKVQVSYSSICLTKKSSKELAGMSARQIKNWIENYFAGFAGRSYCQITSIDIGADESIKQYFKKLEGGVYQFQNV